MGYSLGVDLGTTWTAAAVARNGVATIVSLGRRSAAIPSVVYFGGDGAVLVGDAALRRSIEEPERVAREFKRRVGDEVPILLGTTPWKPEQLQARVLRWVFDTVVTEQGSQPTAITVTHPANWGPFKLDLLAQASAEVGLPSVSLQPEPVAAAAWYASENRIGVGEVVAVYDFGGGTFDVAVVRREPSGFVLLGSPGGIERLGGVDFDMAVLDHVLGQLPATWRQESDDPGVLAEVAELRQRCVEAKEALSFDSVASVLVQHGSDRSTVRVTRDEFESLIRRDISSTIAVTRGALGSAGVRPDGLRAVLLVGGSSRIPLVAQMVGAELGAPVALDANPKHAIALGAALEPPPSARPVAVATAAPVPGPPLVSLVSSDPPEVTRRSNRPIGLALGVGAVLLLALVAGLLMRAGGGDADEEAVDSFERERVDEETTTTTTETETETEEPNQASRLQAGDAEPPPPIAEPDQAALAQACFEGTIAACDDLYFESEVGSEAEEYAMSCGGRIDEPLDGTCLEDLGPAQPLPPAGEPPATNDAEAADLIAGCREGDLVACDDLYFFSDVGSPEEAYGATCGGRLDSESQAGDCLAAFDGPA